jgi:hypothetical protein
MCWLPGLVNGSELIRIVSAAETVAQKKQTPATVKEIRASDSLSTS